MENINERLEALRKIMAREKLAAFIFPSTDPHNGEYVPEHWEGRKWISGFTGSAGTAVVTMDSAALWTDSRYFIAAEDELDGTEYQLMKMKMAGTPTIAEWLCQEIKRGKSTEIGIDGSVYSAAATEELIMDLRRHEGMTLRTNLDPLKLIWTDRPQIPLEKVEVQPIEFAGEDVASKLKRIRRELLRKHAGGMLVGALDDIAWTLNIRGNDIHCNPVAVSYLLVSDDNATLYIKEGKLTEEVRRHLADAGVGVKDYDDIKDALRRYNGYNILMDPNEINYTLYHSINKNVKVVADSSPIPAMKAIKNEKEIEGFRNAMRRDGVALVRFHRWLDEGISRANEEGSEHIVIDGEVQTEMSIDRKLTGLRREQDRFRDISFDTVAAYGAHGAIIHYEATRETDIPLCAKGLLLIDSGAHYQDGTTDITRTIALGQLTDEERLIYTLVLKGHIQLELVKFPDGASGTQIDALARKDMWRYGYNYLHGTGHGVGSYLSVHEGPHQLRMEYRAAPLHPGMTLTDEPGIYLDGKCGVRIENTLLIKKYDTPLEKQGQTLSPTPMFLEMEPLTLCPIDTTPIMWELMSEEEKTWLKNYHQHVYDELSPWLNEADRDWLKRYI